MHRKVILFAIVYDEIEEVVKSYESISEALGDKADTAIRNILLKLTTKASYYYNLDDGVHRRVPVEGFPYMFVYAIQDDTVIVKIPFPLKANPARLLKRLQ